MPRSQGFSMRRNSRRVAGSGNVVEIFRMLGLPGSKKSTKQSSASQVSQSTHCGLAGWWCLTKCVCAQEEKRPPVDGDNGPPGPYAVEEWSAFIMEIVRNSIKVSTSLLAPHPPYQPTRQATRRTPHYEPTRPACVALLRRPSTHFSRASLCISCRHARCASR